MTRNPDAVLPVGTQIVTTTDVRNLLGEVVFPEGTVGVIFKSPRDNTYGYHVRLVDGREAALMRHQFAIHSHFQEEQPPTVKTIQESDLQPYIIYRCIVGSTAYGLETDESDIDRRGFFLPPADWHWSLYELPEELTNQHTQEQYWEIQKFITLALKANPNILECLYTPMVEYATPLAQELRDMRGAFLSRLTYQTYNGYVLSQFNKLQKDIANRGEIRWKHAMHLIRLLLAGITILQTGDVMVEVSEHRERLLAIRRGEIPWEEVNTWRLELHKTFDAAFSTTKLPDHAAYEAANAFLIKARRSMV
jgi:hypothetical protein